MKGLIYLLLLIPTLAFGGIEPDTSIYPMGLDGAIKLPYIDKGQYMLVEKENMNYLNYAIRDLMAIEKLSNELRKEYKYNQSYVDSICQHYDNIVESDKIVMGAYQSQVNALTKINDHNTKMIQDLEDWGERGWKRKRKFPIVAGVITGAVALLVGFIGGFIIGKL